MTFDGLMKGKRGLVMGVANQHSIAWGIAQSLHAAGAELAFSYQGDLFKKRVLPLVELRAEEWRQLMSVHVDGAFHCTQAFLRGMCSRGFGRIVTMSSVAGQAVAPRIAAYATAKGALAALTRALAVEYGPHGITANALAPGYVRTEFTEALQKRPDFERFLRESVPAGRWAIPEDVAPAVVFLASPAAGFINGQTLAIDGGMLASL